MVMKLYTKDRMIMRSVSTLSFLLFLLVSTILFMSPVIHASINNPSTGDLEEFDGTFDWNTGYDTANNRPTSSTAYITYTEYRSTYCTFATSETACDLTDDQKIIRIDTAEELYRWSIDVSFDKKYGTEEDKFSEAQVNTILGQHYALGNNIDYSSMNAKTFSPIGYWFTDAEAVPVLHKNVFHGTFDGQGFTISNLYLGGYDDMVVTYTQGSNTIYIAMSKYYSMFTYNEGAIIDLGLINPTLEMLNLHVDITKTANMVGLNTSTGTVDHVYVIDTRTSVTEAGIRYNVGSSSGFTASGVVHTNEGIFTNAYFSSIMVINGSYFNKFLAQPVLYTNSGSANHLVFDSTVYKYPTIQIGSSTFSVTTLNGLATGEVTSTIKSSSSSLNSETDRWYFYPSDTYPLTQGFDYVGGTYEIEDAVDMAFFSRALSFASENNSVSFAAASYKLKADIDMATIASGAYVTPSVNFTGDFSGETGSSLTENYILFNMAFTTGIIRSTNYYAGLFSVISGSGKVHDLTIDDTTLSLTDTAMYYSNTFFVGVICGRLSGGSIEDVMVNATFNLGTAAIGETHAGMIAGQASGSINRVRVDGTINGGNHTFESTQTIVSKYYLGGIIGSADTSKVSITNVVTNAPITGFGTTSTFNFASGSDSILVKLGGIVGYILNTSSINHSLVNVANKGNITVATVGSASMPASQRVGGVFGELTGYAPILETDEVYQFANLYNSGNIIASYVQNTATIKAAGIGVNNATQAVEYALLFNHGSFTYNNAPESYSALFRYTGTIYDINSGSYVVTLTRAYNYGDRLYDTGFYSNVSPLYYSDTNTPTNLRYCANYGDITYIKNAGATLISLTSNLVVSGITSATNINYLNVANYGAIRLVNLSVGTSYTISVAGISSTLTSGKYMKNCINQGKIIVAKISGGLTSATTGAGNVYVGGLVNRNLSGDLQDSSQSPTQPIATIGIINSMNYGEITSSYDGLDAEANGLYAITGTANVFAGGVATLNSGSIQNCANLGAIRIANTSTTGYWSFAPESESSAAGIVRGFTGGVVAAGIAAVTLNGNARIYDSANNGEIVSIAYNYARSGGVLGICLYEEAVSGGITTSNSTLADTIQNSVLLNGLNFGSITAITANIAQYNASTSTTHFSLYYGTSQNTNGMDLFVTVSTGNPLRPAVYSASGGVIAYGLCIMKRMLNHGTISATDVAGGIVGATYVIGGETTYVNISTAINYGTIEVVGASGYFLESGINKYSMAFSNIDDYYLTSLTTPTRQNFLYPSGFTVEEPLGKRGFGGVFGRLQRGLSGVMTSEDQTNPAVDHEFDFVVNCDKNIDLIGRLDQTNIFCSGSRFFRFNNAIYYSAKWNDTTQVVFTGYYYYTGRTIAAPIGSRAPYTITVGPNGTTGRKYAQVGSVSTDLGTWTGSFTYQSNTATANNTTITTAAYGGHIPVPWITEDPLDAHITNAPAQYMYHESFPMRTNTNLTTYIYYMIEDLLAERFQEGGSNERLKGMYVLSTSAGSTYGAVIPSNINTDLIRPINEDMTGQLTLEADYPIEDDQYLANLDSDVLTKYLALKQTAFNEKSELISNPTIPVKLVQSGGDNTVLTNGTVNYSTKEIEFEISMEAFSNGNVSVSYLVSSAETSAFATIAKRAFDYYGHSPSTAELESYRALLLTEGGLDVSILYPALLSCTIPSKSITPADVSAGLTRFSLGYFTIYSEAFVGSDLFASSMYYTDYHIFVTFTPTAASIPTGTLGISSVSFNDATAVNATSYQTDVTSLGNVNPMGSIKFNFTDTKGVLTDGQDLTKYIELRAADDTTVISSAYYTAEPTLVSSSVGSIKIIFSTQTKSGEYFLHYRYFSNSTEYSVKFDKSPSTASAVTGLTHYSSGTSVSFDGLLIASSINLGYNITLGPSGTGTNFSSSPNGLPSYLSNTTYVVNYNTSFSNTFSISPFAVLTNAYLSNVDYSNGYKVYTIIYVVTAEDGTTQSTYTHTISTRPIDLSSVLKNGNEVSLLGITAAREDDFTYFICDLGLDSTIADLYNVDSQTYPYIAVSATLDSVPISTPGNGITYSIDDMLLITMSYAADPGVYVFTFYFYRDEINYVTLATTLTITKQKGTNSYLTNIKFSEYMTETTYPNITIVNAAGTTNITPTPTNDPRAYFGGFDYDGADLNTTYHYQVDGYVSNTPLNSYVPSLVAYLPYGGSISRHAYDKNTSTWYWTTEVTANSTPAEIATLATDYTVDPETGFEATGDDMIRIQYRVLAENGNPSSPTEDSFTYYWITVTDVTYNLSMVFDIYYCTGELESTCVLASNSEDFANQLVMINVKNYETNGTIVTTPTTPATYPSFTQLGPLKTQLTQFYLTYAGDYQYSFGRNISGFYIIRVDLPQDIYLNEIYTYEIEINDVALHDASDYVTGVAGKYFYIEPSTRNRTRRFNVYIREISSPSTDAPWGLYDFFRSWWENL